MIETQIRDSLLRLTQAIEQGDAAAIKANMAEIEDAAKTHRRDLDAQLKHFLRNRSYMKALMYLNGESEIPKGRCGGRTDFS